MGYYNRQNKVLNDLISKNKTSPFAAQQLSLAKNMFGGRMAGAPQLQNNIFSSQGGAMDFAQRNATDSSQALAIAAGLQGQTNEDLAGLQIREQQNQSAMLQNLNQAYGINIDEGRNQFQNEVALKGAKAQNELAKRKALWNTVGQVANLGVSALTGGMFGGGMFGGSGSSGGGGAAGGLGSIVGSAAGQASSPFGYGGWRRGGN